jgi:hypothetical protein
MSKSPSIVVFVVEGRGEFPIDMLRYDQCWPRREIDSGTIRRTNETRKVELMCINTTGRKPTEARWKSFGWTVTTVVK